MIQTSSRTGRSATPGLDSTLSAAVYSRALKVFGGRCLVAGLANQFLHESGDIVAGRTGDPVHVQLERAGRDVDCEFKFRHARCSQYRTRSLISVPSLTR